MKVGYGGEMFHTFYLPLDIIHVEEARDYFHKLMSPSEVTLMEMIFHPTLKEWLE